jgi:hypothetical protein
MAQRVEAKSLGVSSQATVVLPIRTGFVPGESRSCRVLLE